MPNIIDQGTLNWGSFHVISIAVVFFGVNVTNRPEVAAVQGTRKKKM
jgi:hypothetical protein